MWASATGSSRGLVVVVAVVAGRVVVRSSVVGEIDEPGWAFGGDETHPADNSIEAATVVITHRDDRVIGPALATSMAHRLGGAFRPSRTPG